MATWKKITTEADVTAISASLTTTDQAISASVAALSGSASDARDLLANDTSLSGSASDARNELVTKISGSSTAPIAALSSSLTITDQAISASVAALSGSASDARNALSTDIELAALSASLTITDQSISSSVATLSGSSSDARNELVDAISGSSTLPINTLRIEVLGYSASLHNADQIISSSVAALSGSASDARNALANDTSLSGSASDARNELVTKISGSSTAPIAALSSSLTTTDQIISSSVAALSGSASDARNVLGAISGSASDARNELVTKISGSSTLPISNLSASLTTTDQAISASVAALSGSASDARNVLGAISGSASDARNELVTKISGSSTAPIATLSGSLTTTDQVISSSVATLSGSASDARDLLVTQIAADNVISFGAQDQGRFSFIQGSEAALLYDVIGLKPADDVTFNDLQVNGAAIVEGDLTVKGTTTSVQTTNLLVEDKFALFASGSTSSTDGGLIIQSAADGSGKALGYSQANSRWSLQGSLAHDATTFSSVDAFLGTVETSTAIPSTAPVYGVGTIHVKTDTEDIYIYS